MSKAKEKPFAMPKQGEVNPFFDSKSSPYPGSSNIAEGDGWAGIALIKDALLLQYGEQITMTYKTATQLLRAIWWLTERAGLTHKNLCDYSFALSELYRETKRYERRIQRISVAHLKSRLGRVRFEVAREMRKLRAIRATIRMERAKPRANNSMVLAESHRESAIRKVYIYGLVASDKPEVVEYVGQTYSPHSRLEGHRKSGMPGIKRLFEDAHSRGASVQMVLIEEVTRENADKRERHFISLYSSARMARLNTTGVYWTSEYTIGRAA
jgi:hypothetical protein